MRAYTYILECADGTLYTGWTNDLEKRLAAHNAGQGAKYTRGRGPVRRRPELRRESVNGGTAAAIGAASPALDAAIRPRV